ncbi:MAG: DUF2007 domain-containing protein [Pedobacter sp.]|nr:DUF2007 domain-containing protein [Pedobacter sp.]MDQ8054115.1 DUF2007 domain-containing protein [Pedobacter sp.]
MEDKIVVYSSYYNPIEANIIKARLDDSDIPCFLTDENVATIQPMYNQAIGGVKLNVFEKDIERIDQLLAEENLALPDSENAQTTEQVICEKCGSTNVGLGQATKKRFSWWVTLLSLLFFIYPFKTNKCYHCYDCGHEFT